MRVARSWCTARQPRHSRCCSLRCANTGSRSRDTRPPKSTSGWRSPTGLGDTEVAAADAATAQSIYDQLGVEPAGNLRVEAPGGLTKRELEILTAIAGGATNRQVAQQIFISEKTVGGISPTSTRSSGCHPAPPRRPGRTSTTC